MIYLVASASIFIFSPSTEQDMTSVPRDKCTTNQLNATYFPFLSNYSQHFDILDSPTSFNSFIRQETKIVSRAGYSFKYHSLVASSNNIYFTHHTFTQWIPALNEAQECMNIRSCVPHLSTSSKGTRDYNARWSALHPTTSIDPEIIPKIYTYIYIAVLKLVTRFQNFTRFIRG